MNYRHSYHAGSFSDVFKHTILVGLLQALLRKDKPFCYLDTHAGIGLYDLQSQSAQKTLEAKTGIVKILTQKKLPPLINTYCDIVKACNNAKGLQFYPGSPWIVQQLLREHDRMLLCELHDEDVQILRQQLPKDKHLAIHHMDGYQALKAFLPPTERRGLVLIDPPYEQENEFVQILQGLNDAWQRFPTGIYAIWYPCKNQLAINKWLRQLKQLVQQDFLQCELYIYPKDSPSGLSGNGMVILNAPWQFEQSLQEELACLWRVLSIDQQGSFTVMCN